MRYFSGRACLKLCRYGEAEKEFRAAVRFRPRFWLAGCHLAETLVCLGRPGGSAAIFERLARALPEVRAELLAWHGETLLWMGRWREALVKLSDAVEAGSWLAVCWRGAANVIGGRHAQALRDLDRATMPGSRDGEAYIWRGELLRRMGRRSEAMADLDRAVALGDPVWSRWNRALLHAQKGDMASMRADFAALSPGLIAAVERRLGSSGSSSRSDAERVRLLEGGLSLAFGVRRSDPYLQRIWMEDGPRRAVLGLERRRRPAPGRETTS